MIKHLSQGVLLSFLAVVLTACGGGGGGGTSSNSRITNFTVSAIANAGGSISPGSASVSQGSSTSFTVTPDAGYAVDSVIGCSGSLSGNSYTTGSVNSDCTVTASFIREFQVDATASAGGTISPGSAAVREGETTSFTVTGDPGYLIDTVAGCGGTLSGSTYTTGTITAACSVTATFLQQTFEVTTTVSAGGAIGPTSSTVNYNDVVMLAVVANPGWRIFGVTGCGGSLDGSIYSTSAITSACEISASFEAIQGAQPFVELDHRRPSQENYSLQYVLEALLLATNGDIPRWNYAGPLGSPTTLRYSFAGSVNGYPVGESGIEYRDFSDLEMDAIRQVLQRISDVTLLEFVETGDLDGIDVINFVIAVGCGGVGGIPPANAAGAQSLNGGRVYIGQCSLAKLAPVPGQWAWDEVHDIADAKRVIAHEIGHALGLKHPGNYFGESDPRVLVATEDNQFYSVMAYPANGGNNHLTMSATEPQKYDLVALQYLYGTRTQPSQTTTWAFDDNYRSRGLIHDITGLGILDLTGSDSESIIDLTPGAFSSFGVNIVEYSQDTYGDYQNRPYNNLATSYDTLLKDVRSGSGNNTIYDNSLDNTVNTGGGNDVVFSLEGDNSIDGGDGVDIVRYNLPQNEYSVQAIMDGVVVEHLVSGRQDSLYSIEFLVFDNIPYETTDLCICSN